MLATKYTSIDEIPNRVNNGDVIKVYYSIDDTQLKNIGYSVEYYKDNVKIEADTINVSGGKVKAYDSYKLSIIVSSLL